MKKTIFMVFVILLLYSCGHITVRKHPDYNFKPTKPSSIRIYTKELMPIKKFIIIGQIKIDRTLSLPSLVRKKVQISASKLGGDGVLILNTRIDIATFNRGVKTTGRIDVTSSTIVYSETRRDTTAYIPVIVDYGYVIRFFNGNTR